MIDLSVVLSYAAAGLSVIATGSDKLPRVGGSWKAYQAQRATEAELRGWFSKGDNAAAIVCGAVSGGLEMVDFDCGAEWYPIWAELLEQDALGLVARLVVEQSQSGGKHVVYRVEGGALDGNKKLAQRVTPAPSAEQLEIRGKKYKPMKRADGSFSVVETLIETRGEGGYFLCAPSKGYTLLQGSFTELPVITAAERAAIVKAAIVLDEYRVIEEERKQPAAQRHHAAHTGLNGETSGTQRRGAQAGSPGGQGAGGQGGSDGKRPGDAFNERGDIRALLQKHGWVHVLGRGEREYWRRPGKAKGWSASLTEGRVFWPFTSNAAPFEMQKSYTPFAVFALLECGGDYVKAAELLQAQGFGAPRAAPISEPSGPETVVEIPDESSTTTGSTEGQNDARSAPSNPPDAAGNTATPSSGAGGGGKPPKNAGEGAAAVEPDDDDFSEAGGGAYGGENGLNALDSALLEAAERDKKAVWLDTKFTEMLMNVSMLTGSKRAAAVGDLFRSLALNLSGRDAATEALVRERVCDRLGELKKSDYERCMREAKAKLQAERSQRGDSAAADGDQSDWGGLAKKFIAAEAGRERVIVYWRESYYEWTKARGYYALRKDPKWIRKEVTKWLYSEGMPIGLQQVGNFINAFDAMSYIEEEVRPPCWLRNVDGKVRQHGKVYISLANGILDLESVHFEIGDVIIHAPLIEHTPDFFTLNSLPYNFKPDAQCPQLDDAIAQWQPKSEERDPEGLGARVLQDFAGYVLEPGQPHQVMLINHGPGDDGKSQYKDLVIALAGVNNTSSLGLEALDPQNTYGKEDLLGKTLWTVPDANQIEKLGEGTLKAITGGDRVTIPRKFKGAETGPIEAKVLMNCNEFPGFKDRSEGVWRRILLLHWQPVTGAKVRDFAKKLIADEMPGIFIWALRGWRRVRDAGFARRGVLIENVQKFRRETQHEFSFFDQCVEIITEQDAEGNDVEGKVSNEQLIQAYKDWCSDNNIKPFVHPETMGRALTKWVRWSLERMDPVWAGEEIAKFIEEKRFRTRRSEAGKKRSWYYTRIRLLENDEAEEFEAGGGWRGLSKARKAPLTLYKE